MKKAITIIPIYKKKLSPLEEYSLKYSLKFIDNKNSVFICPFDLDKAYYFKNFPEVLFHEYNNCFFESIRDYNRLMLSKDFYSNYLSFDYILILQTDAIILKNELDKWINLNYDYIGAPWPEKFKLLLSYDAFNKKNYMVEASVGNGGFSLRSVKGVIRLIDEFPEAIDFFKETGSSEDLFFATYGLGSKYFNTPNEIIASLFSLELQPQKYFELNGNQLPFGGHAWWKYDINFWIDKFVNKSVVYDAIKREGLMAIYA